MLTRERLLEVLGDLVKGVDSEVIDDAVTAGNCDPMEGAEWLPYYKASFSLLTWVAGAFGGVCQGIIQNPAAPPKLKKKFAEYQDELLRILSASLMLSHSGSETDPVFLADARDAVGTITASLVERHDPAK